MAARSGRGPRRCAGLFWFWSALKQLSPQPGRITRGFRAAAESKHQQRGAVMSRNGPSKAPAQAQGSETATKVRRPTFAESLIPVVGPAWEAVADFEDGNIGGGAFNAAMAVLDVAPVGVVVKGARAASKGVGIWKSGSVTADAARKQLRKKGVAGVGTEIHHTVRLNGKSRNAQDWRNHYAFLKVLPKEQHRRLTGSWDGKPMYDPLRRAWYGTTDWQKAYPLYGVTHLGVAGEKALDPFAGPAAEERKRRAK